MNKLKIILIAGLFVLTSLLIYYLLGGFRPVEFTVISNISYTIIGKEYVGTNNTRELKELFDGTKQLLESSFSEATLIIVNDDNKYDDENNQVGYFIGILVKSVPSSIPEGYAVKEYGPVKVIRARILSHNLVMPKPDNVKRKAAELAESESGGLSSISMEKYPEEGIIEVDFLLAR